MTLRAARSADAPELAALMIELGYPSSAVDIERRLPLVQDAGDLAMVAVDGRDRAVGFLHAAVKRVLQVDVRVEIVALVVGPGFRGSGLGAKLVARAEAWTREQGLSQIVVRSNVKRERTHRFYLRAGYALSKSSHVFAKSL